MYSVIIPIIMGIIQIKKLTNYLLLLLILLLFSCFTDFLVYFNNESRKFAWPLFIIFQFVLLYLIFRFNSSSSKKKKNLILSILAFLIYSVVYLLILKDLNKFYPNLMTISIFSFLVVSLQSFHEMYNKLNHENLFIYPFFWINVAVLIYFSGNLFLTISYNIFSHKLRELIEFVFKRLKNSLSIS